MLIEQLIPSRFRTRPVARQVRTATAAPRWLPNLNTACSTGFPFSGCGTCWYTVLCS
ncbi:hypothetical protein MUN84_18445 [Hymenobacter sp. 5516J-16]|uniref:hypothetical protein n=1 Tax=Hymenobacter sp. 5516J-16 TaxID=2932253 RepID=UPI001FD2AE24|nr:hypothetical protein [Hymenobacter sp. 5516J-16]UOQ76500.1 hypothetical protein MUN84_18445 [Hymenobacter sp. 5516J-16]